jgi:hypothetical protein
MIKEHCTDKNAGFLTTSIWVTSEMALITIQVILFKTWPKTSIIYAKSSLWYFLIPRYPILKMKSRGDDKLWGRRRLQYFQNYQLYEIICRANSYERTNRRTCWLSISLFSIDIVNRFIRIAVMLKCSYFNIMILHGALISTSLDYRSCIISIELNDEIPSIINFDSTLNHDNYQSEIKLS